MIRGSEPNDSRSDGPNENDPNELPSRDGLEEREPGDDAGVVEPGTDGPNASGDQNDEPAVGARQRGTEVDQAIAEAFEEELASATRKAEENWDRYLRAEAELENARKRAEKRREEALALQRREMLSKLLEVMDNLERALSHGEDDPKVLLDGVETTYRELARVLARDGVEQIAAMEQPFDPELHEAVGIVPMPAGEEEKVVAIDRPGYTIHGRLLRPARVLVGKPAEPAEPDGEL